MPIVEAISRQTALGGSAEIGLVFEKAEIDVTTFFDQLWREVFAFEATFSRFLPNSELTRFNMMAGQRVVVSPEFREVLLMAKKMSLLSEGLFNPFILPALQRSGYVNSALAGYENDAQADFSQRVVTGINSLKLYPEHAEIPYNTALDFGGCGKGYLAKKIIKKLHLNGIVGGWVAFDGDTVSFGSDEHGEPMRTAIQSAQDPAKTLNLQIVGDLREIAVATSGTLKRPIHRSKKQWHHIINPITFEPAHTDMVLATVIDRDALKADVLASCTVILGSLGAEDFLRRKKVDGWVLQYKKPNGSVEIKQWGSMLETASLQLAGAQL